MKFAGKKPVVCILAVLVVCLLTACAEGHVKTYRYSKQDDILDDYLIKTEYYEDKLAELEEELEKGDKERAEKEFGDFLFSLVNAGRLYGLNPDTALEETNKKFIKRFNYIEEHSLKIGKPLKEMTLGEMDALWNEAKRNE